MSIWNIEVSTKKLVKNIDKINAFSKKSFIWKNSPESITLIFKCFCRTCRQSYR